MPLYGIDLQTAFRNNNRQPRLQYANSGLFAFLRFCRVAGDNIKCYSQSWRFFRRLFFREQCIYWLVEDIEWWFIGSLGKGIAADVEKVGGQSV